jgi:hypothetical protein
MKQTLHILSALLLPMCMMGQVDLDTRIEFTGPPAQRGVDGLAPATVNTSAITVEASLLGTPHWGTATISGSLISVEQTVNPEAHHIGQLIRFVAPASVHGAIQLRIGLLPPLPLLRSDGQTVASGQVRSGAVVEVVNAGEHWVLVAPGEGNCPPGSLQVQDNLCMDAAPASLRSVYEAADLCLEKGGKLCTWGEYYLGCTVLAGQLQGMFQEWEWLDDTSNHTHTADQGGRNTCRSQRASNPVLVQGRVRCCYRPR